MGRKSQCAKSGRKGGKASLKKFGADHFRRLALRRKKRGGGRPRKNALIVSHL